MKTFPPLPAAAAPVRCEVAIAPRRGQSIPNYDVYSVNGELLHGDIRLERAAEIANLSVEEIEWAIEEYGRCDTDEVVIVRNEDVWPGSWEA